MKKLLLVMVGVMLLTSSLFAVGEDEYFGVLWPVDTTAYGKAYATMMAQNDYFDLSAYDGVGRVTVHVGIVVADADVDSTQFFLEFSGDPEPGGKWVQADSSGVSAVVSGDVMSQAQSNGVMMRYMRVTYKSEGLAADAATQTPHYFVWVTLYDGAGNYIGTVGEANQLKNHVSTAG